MLVQSRLAEELEGLSLDDLPPDLGLSDLSDLLSDLLLDSDLLPDADFSPDLESLDEALSDDDPLDSLDSEELELLARESVT